MTYCIMKASREPVTIPVEMVIPMKAPTWPLASPSTVCGAFTAHKVLTYPFVIENSARLRITNQSEEKRAAGATSKLIRRKVTKKIVRKAELILMTRLLRRRQETPPMYLPIVSIKLKHAWMNMKC